QEVEGGGERLLVVVAPSHREDPAVAEDVGGRTVVEQLRFGHKAHAAANERAGEEVVHERAVIRSENHGTVGHVLGPDAASPEGDEEVGHENVTRRLVRPTGFAAPGPLMEAVEVLPGPLVAVDLRL